MEKKLVDLFFFIFIEKFYIVEKKISRYIQLKRLENFKDLKKFCFKDFEL